MDSSPRQEGPRKKTSKRVCIGALLKSFDDDLQKSPKTYPFTFFPRWPHGTRWTNSMAVPAGSINLY